MNYDNKPELQWALPPAAQTPPDRLAFRIDIYQESILLYDYEYRNNDDHPGTTIETRLVSAGDLTRIIGQHSRFHTGLLSANVLWKTMTANGIFTGWWQPPKVWDIALQAEPFEPTERLKLPMPGLVFIHTPHQAPWVFAAARKPRRKGDKLYHAPTYNVFQNGRVCPGNHAFPQDPDSLPESFFQSFFSPVEENNKSRKYPNNLGRLWKELNGKTKYPLEDLVPQCTLAEAIAIDRL